MKRFSVTGFFIIMMITAVGQNSELRLEQCHELALRNHPVSGQGELYIEASGIQQKIIDKNNLPQFNLNGQATYQSAVTKLPISIPGINIPEVPQEQFKISLDATQVLYGGGATAAQRLLEEKNLQINTRTNETELYKLKERINQLYFGIMLINNSMDVLKINLDELQSRLNKTESGIRNGLILPYNATILESEKLKVNQKLIDLNSQKTSFIGMLSLLTGIDIPVDVILIEPEIVYQSGNYLNKRPEMSLFDLQSDRIDVMKKMTGIKTHPRAFAFGNLGYGRPGLNMFKEEADVYYMLGAKVTWNFWNWNQNREENRILDINKQIVQQQKETFDLNIKTQARQYLSEISRSEELLAGDEKLILMRADISKAVASQLENGIITATEYLTDYNAEIQARLSKELHKVQYLQAKAAYLALTGNL
jgi:outer membrane protein TolC